MRCVCVTRVRIGDPDLQELERSSCGGGVALPAGPCLRARRTGGVFLRLDGLLVHARGHILQAEPEDQAPEVS